MRRRWSGSGAGSVWRVDPTNRNTALASAMVEELARCGVRRAAIAPGSRSTPLAVALWRQPQIDATVIVDERCAGFFAVGAAQADGRPTAVLCTSGSAAANLHPAVVEADEAGVPVIVLTADRPPELRGVGAGQTIDQLKLYGSAVRWFCELGTHEADDAGLIHFRSVACRAYAAACGEPRPGPVHLNVPWREPLAPEPREGEVTASAELAVGGRADRPLTEVRPPAGTLTPDLLDELAERIAASPRGLIACGRQPDPTIADAVAALGAAAGYPILAEPTSQLRLGPHDRAGVVWTYDAIARARSAQLAPELVLRFGDLPTSKPLRQWLAEPGDLRQIVVDPDGGWNEPTRLAETVVRASPGPLASGLAERLGAGRADQWSEDWLGANAAAAAAIAAELNGLVKPTEPGLHAALGRIYADGDVVYTASSMPIRDQEQFVAPSAAGVRFLCNRGANGIDGLISSGIGAAAASDRPTWIVTGDLGLYHDMNALALLSTIDAPVRIVVPNNGGGAIFDFLPQATAIDRDEFEALFTTPLHLKIDRIAGLYGVEHREVRDLDDLEDAASAAGAVIVEVPVERAGNVELHARLASAVLDAIAT